ncbi:pentatricopeptide repeat-containing protein [Hordeum vulgare]|nr:pentatricopeptide repeat-containing protein [Hordeum vulgare]
MRHAVLFILWNAVFGALPWACRLDGPVVYFWRMASSMLKVFDPIVMLSGASRAGELELRKALPTAAKIRLTLT